jgi:acyl-CoA dehydrogenase
MLGAIVILLLLAAAAYAVTTAGGAIALLFIAAVLFLAYKRLSLLTFTATFTVLLTAYTLFGESSAPAGVWRGFLWLMVAALWLLNVRPLRKALISRRFLKTYIKLLPAMSQTEREALEAGTVWWDGELFTGAPKWSKLLSAKPPRLSPEEQAFIDGPCEELCRMLDDWDITHKRGDMPPQVWDYLKSKGFFAMIIPKKYGGLEFRRTPTHACSPRWAVVASRHLRPLPCRTRLAPRSC